MNSGESASGEAAQDVRRRRAFGVDIAAGIDMDGLLRDATGADGRFLDLRPAERDEIDRTWRGTQAERVLERYDESGRTFMTVDVSDDLGYRVWARRHGAYLVAHDGRRALCAPPAGAAWRWQRLVLAQVLPLAAVLQSLEILHASAVTVDGSAVAFVGRSGAGKTSVAAHAVAQGARMLTDDVLAIELGDGHVVSHPGAAVARLVPHEARALLATPGGRTAEVLAEGEKTHVRLPLADGASPLRLLYWLDRDAGTEGIHVTALEQASQLLLGSAFLPYVQSTARLSNQLAVCSIAAVTARAFVVRAPADVRAEDMARAALAHARAQLA